MKKTFVVSVFALALVLSIDVAPVRAQDSVEDITLRAIAGPAGAKVSAPENQNTMAKGYRFHNFILTPSIEVKESYADNIFTIDSGKTDDFITRISPDIMVKSVDMPHALQFSAGLDQLLYADHRAINYANYNASFKDRYKFDKTLSWEGSLDYRKVHSLPGDSDANPAGDAGEPLPYNIYSARTSFIKNFGKITAEPRLAFTRYEYENVRRNNGLMLDQGYRDRGESIVGGRFGFDLNKRIALYTDLEYSPRQYKQTSATERDSDGGSYLAGVRYHAGKDLNLEAGAGFMNRDYDTAAYEDIDTYDLAARADWTIQPGFKLRAALNRSISEITDAGAGGVIRTELRADLTHELMQDLSGEIGGRWISNDYQGGNGADSGTSDREDAFCQANAGAKYMLSPAIFFTVDYTYSNNTSNRSSAEYVENVFTLGVRADF